MKISEKYDILTCHALYDRLEVGFTVFRVLSCGTVQYALYVAKAETTRADVSGHAAVRVVVVLDVDQFGDIFSAE